MSLYYEYNVVEALSFTSHRDTVASVGLFRDKLLPLATESCEHICLFRHALALDECRVNFLPECVYGSSSAVPEEGYLHARPHKPAGAVPGLCSTGIGGDETEDSPVYWEWEPLLCKYLRRWNEPQNQPRIKEVWFAGCHGDMFVISIGYL